jgi:hypothetical protein
MLVRARAYTAERAAERKAARDKRKGRCEHCRESMPVQRGTRRFWRSASDAPRKKQGGSGAVGLSDRTKNIHSKSKTASRVIFVAKLQLSPPFEALPRYASCLIASFARRLLQGIVCIFERKVVRQH